MTGQYHDGKAGEEANVSLHDSMCRIRACIRASSTIGRVAAL